MKYHPLARPSYDEWRPAKLNLMEGDGDGGGGGFDGGFSSGFGGGGDWGSAGAFDASGFNADAFGAFDVGQSLAFDAGMGGLPGVTTGPGEWAGWGSWATPEAIAAGGISGNLVGMNAPGGPFG